MSRLHLFRVLAQSRAWNPPCFAAMALIWAAGFTVVAPSVQAEERVAPPGYREAILEALAEYEAQNYLEARSLFVQAHELLPNARTLRGLGIVSFELRRYSESIDFLEQALASDPNRLDDKMRAEVERLLARARTFVAQIKVTVDPGDARVAIDGLEAGPIPDRLLLDVGTHQLDFQAPGYLPLRRSLAVVGAERSALSISLHKEGSDDSDLARAQSSPVPSRAGKVVGGTVIALGVASFALTRVFMGQRRDAGASLREVEESTFNPKKLSDWEDSRAKPYLSAALGSAAVTAGALGLLLSAPRERFPWWASMLAGLGGAGLVAWGASDVAHGASCELPERLRGRCTIPLAQRDRGVIVILSAAPLLVVPLVQLLRKAIAPSRSNSTLAFDIQTDPLQRAVVLDASVQWL